MVFLEIQLRVVTTGNLDECVALKKESVAYHIAQAKVTPCCWPMGAYLGQDLIGFVMYGLCPRDGQYWILALMVGEQYQGLGLERAVLEKVLGILKETMDCTAVYVRIASEDVAAQTLFFNMGFRWVGGNPPLGGNASACLEVKR